MAESASDTAREVAAIPILDGGIPLLGHMPEMYRSFPELCARGAKAHGPLFWINGGPGARQLMCTHASAIDVLKDRAVSTSFYAEGFSTLLSGTLFSFDGDEHRRVRGPMAPAFTPKRVRSSDVLAIVEAVSRAHMARWIAAGRIEVLAATQELALEIIVRMIGVPITDLKQWRRHYERYLLGGIPSKRTTPLHWWARRARDWLDAGLRKIVEDLRSSGNEDSLVGAIANGRDESGVYLPLELVLPNLRLLVLAGHETTASGLAWAILHQAQSRASWERAIGEVTDVDDLAALTVDAERFTWAERQFREAIRMYPPVHSVIRKLGEPTTIAGTEIPTGTLLNIPLVHLLRDPNRWTNPNEFDPARYESRPRPTTIETAMFGGGPHFCIGYHVAIAEGTLVMLQLARALADAGVRMVPERAGPLPAPIWLPLAHPPRKLAVRFEPS